MTGEHEPQEQPLVAGGSAAVVRAIGALLVALAGGESGAARPAHVRAEAQRVDAAVGEAVPGPTETDDAGPEAGASVEDAVAEVLEEGRSRAQAVLDDSLQQAATLLEQRARQAGDEPEAIAGVRRALQRLADDVGDLRERLDRIERLVSAESESQLAPPSGGSSAQHESPSTPRAASAVQAAPSLSVVRSEPAWTETPSDDAPPAAAPAHPTEAPVEPPPDEPADEEPPAEYAAEQAAVPEPPRAPRSLATARATSVREVLEPAGGPVLVRISPVAGFQGLMRVQDALGRLHAIRQATVEAYAQGEARMRIELHAATTPAGIASGLSSELQQAAQVREASAPDRSVTIVLA